MTRHVVVLGDALLDVDVDTRSERLVPDSLAAPVLDEVARSQRPGGAALAATLAARDPDTEVTLITAIGEDQAGAVLRELLTGRVRVIELPGTGSTGVKTRLLKGCDIVARLDQGGRSLRVGSLSRTASDALDSADALLVSDYGRGLTAAASVRSALATTTSRAPVVWDPHPRGGDPLPGCRVATPNVAEAATASRSGQAQSIGGACRQARALVRSWSVGGVALTLGARGAVLASGADTTALFPAPPAVNGDACGAGDRFAARVATALAAGALTSEAVHEAVEAASAFVAASGTAAPQVGSSDGGELRRLLDSVRGSGGLVVATGGCFDVLHAGHIATLEAARSLGDCLVVCVNSDASVRRQKGEGRPVQPGPDRVRLLQALRCVDAVVVFDEDTPERAIAAVRPDLWVKGGDYAGSDLPETELVRSWDGEVVTVPYLAGRSTTSVLSRIP